jgi:hypothetical protein
LIVVCLVQNPSTFCSVCFAHMREGDTGRRGNSPSAPLIYYRHLSNELGAWWYYPTTRLKLPPSLELLPESRWRFCKKSRKRIPLPPFLIVLIRIALCVTHFSLLSCARDHKTCWNRPRSGYYSLVRKVQLYRSRIVQVHRGPLQLGRTS